MSRPRTIDRAQARASRTGKRPQGPQVHEGTFAVYQAGGNTAVGWVHRPPYSDIEFWVLVDGVWSYPGQDWKVAGLVLRFIYNPDPEEFTYISEFVNFLRSHETPGNLPSAGGLGRPDLSNVDLVPLEHWILTYEIDHH